MTLTTLPPFPDVERAVCDLLADLGATGTETRPGMSLPYIRVTRTGGTGDLITDLADVEVAVWAEDATEAKSVAELVRQRLIGGPYRGASFATSHGKIDHAETTSGPVSLPPTDSDNLRLVTASYQVTMRR
jgi:hypothetical protein